MVHRNRFFVILERNFRFDALILNQRLNFRKFYYDKLATRSMIDFKAVASSYQLAAKIADN